MTINPRYPLFLASHAFNWTTVNNIIPIVIFRKHRPNYRCNDTHMITWLSSLLFSPLFVSFLSIVTIGPLVLLGLLGITFYIGLRHLKLAHRGNSTGNINIAERKEIIDVNMSSSDTALFTSVNDAKKTQSSTQGVVSANELSVRRILNEGPGHDPNSEQVSRRGPQIFLTPYIIRKTVDVQVLGGRNATIRVWLLLALFTCDC